MAFLDEVARGGETGGAAADDGHTFAGGRGDGGQPELAALALEVGDKALEVADGDGLAFLAEHAAAFALTFLRANAAGDGGQGIVFAHLSGGGEKIAGIDECDDFLDLDADGAIDWQPGLAQAMQRVASVMAPEAARPRLTSAKLWTRVSGSSSGMGRRGIFMRSLSGRGFAGRGGVSGIRRLRGTVRAANWVCGRGRRRHTFFKLCGLLEARAQLRGLFLFGGDAGAYAGEFLLLCASRNALATGTPCSRYMALRCMRTSKFTSEASNSGPSTQANLLWLPSSTRQPPHMPVPSTMMELRLTMVLMPSGAVMRGDGAHHGHGADGEDEVDLAAGGDELVELLGDQALFAVAAVVGEDVGFVAGCADFVFKDDHLAAARALNKDDVVAGVA